MSKARHSRGIEKSVTQFLNSQLKTYTYNQNQRLTQVTDTGSVLGEYIYNGNGQRADKLIPSQNKCTVFHYDQNGSLITESTRTGNIKAEYVYLNGQPLAKIENNNVYYYHNDHLGTPITMTDSSGSVVWSGEYLPFGESLSITGSVTNNLRFPGQYFDSETGLHQNWWRDYRSQTGTYPQADPIGLAGGINLYSYVHSNPVNFVDPLGLFCTYSQSSGLMLCTDDKTSKVYYVGLGYSGARSGYGYNNPEMQGEKDVGPIPRGQWQMEGNWYEHSYLGKNTMKLVPLAGNECYDTNRNCDTFRMHGDNRIKDASQGCIVLPADRTKIKRGEIIEVVR